MSNKSRNPIQIILMLCFIALFLSSWIGRIVLLIILLYALKPSWFSWIEDTPINDTIGRYFILLILGILIAWGHYSMKFS